MMKWCGLPIGFHSVNWNGIILKYKQELNNKKDLSKIKWINKLQEIHKLCTVSYNVIPLIGTDNNEIVLCHVFPDWFDSGFIH